MTEHNTVRPQPLADIGESQQDSFADGNSVIPERATHALENKLSRIIDTSADVEAAASAISSDLARDIRSRQESIATKRSRAPGRIALREQRSRLK